MEKPKNINEFIEQNRQSKLNQGKIKSRRENTPNPSTTPPIIPPAITSDKNNQNLENPTPANNPDYNSSTTEQPANQDKAKTEQPQEPSQKKLSIFRFRKRMKLMKELKKLDKNLKKVEKLAGKYKFSTFFGLTLIAIFVDISDFLINIFFSLILLIPIGIIFWIIKQLASGIIWIKIHSIVVNQKTDESFIATFAVISIELVPYLSLLPTATLRVLKAWHAAHAKFQKRQNAIKSLQKKIYYLQKQLFGMSRYRQPEQRQEQKAA